MSICFWSAKGGSGCSAVAAGVAVALSKAHGEALLVDMAGDLPAVLGARQPAGPGLAEWLCGGRNVPPDALGRLETDVTPALRLLSSGGAPGRPLACSRQRAELFARLLGQQDRPVVVDAGLVASPHPSGEHSDQRSGDDVCNPGEVVAARAHVSLLVTRLCYLALHRAAVIDIRPSGVVVVAESERALESSDVARVVGAPVVAEIRSDPGIARALDSGLLVARPPRALAQGAAEVLTGVA